MKGLSNPWIVGSLCVIAAGVVGYQALPARRAVAAAPAPVNLAPAPVAGPTIPVAATNPARSPNPGTQATNQPAPAMLADRSYAQSHFAQWVDSPRRDPFLLPPAPKPVGGTNSPLAQWKLKAIWRQTGSRLAAIDHRIYSEGDEIDGYRIEQIDADRVWFQGPAGRESLGFVKPSPPGPHSARTNPTAIK